MKKLLIIIAVLGGLVAAYLYAYPIYNFRYRVTVEVEVDGSVRSGESVVAARWAAVPPIIPMGAAKEFDIILRGEAVFVDLGASRLPLILTLSDNAAPHGCRSCMNFVYLPLRAYEVSQDRKGLSTLGAKMKSRVEVDPSSLPGFVTFDDLADPGSVRFVHPRRMDEVLGPGVRLRAVTIEATNASVTYRLEEKLPWLREPRKFSTIGHLGGANAGLLGDYDLIQRE